VSDMGEIADMMINGELCEWCGDYLGDDAGYPRLCPACQAESRKDGPLHASLENEKEKVKCPTCGKRVKFIGLDQHIHDKHGGKP